MHTHPTFSCYLIGSESLLVQCGEILLESGHSVRGVLSADAAVRRWATAKGIGVLDPRSDQVVDALREEPFDYLFSIANVSMIPPRVLELPRKGAVNFHDGPLPRYGGLHATAWALIAGEPSHGVTWHLMTERADEGDILLQRDIPIAADETSLTLNAKCYEAAIESFRDLVGALAADRAERRPHVLDRATFHAGFARPEMAGALRWDRSAEELGALARALDFGSYVNPLVVPKLVLGDSVLLAPTVELLPESSGEAPGTVVALGDALVVATRTTDVALRTIFTADGEALPAAECARHHGLRVGSRLADPETSRAARITALVRTLARHEAFWVERLGALEPVDLPYASSAGAGRESARYATRPMRLDAGLLDAMRRSDDSAVLGDLLLASFAAYLHRLSGKESFDLGFRDASLRRTLSGAEGWFAPCVPLRAEAGSWATFADAASSMAQELARLRARGSYASDVVLRYPSLRSAPASARRFPVAVVQVEQADDPWEPLGTELTLVLPADGERCRWIYDEAVLTAADVERMERQLAVFLRGIAADARRPLRDIPLLDADERRRMLVEWNATGTATAAGRCVHELVEEQVERTPDSTALVFEGERLTYRELDERAEVVARQLRGLGVGTDSLVGLCMERSIDLVVGLLGIHKAGGAYVPIDPTYPRERIAFMLEDAQLPVLLTQERLLNELPECAADVVCIERMGETEPPPSRDGGSAGATPESLAYVIYTSGSTGRPKGVMVAHGNVVNFFAGMDARLGTEPGVWLALTSLSFDISVLELLWTLTRGYTVVVSAEVTRALPAAAAGATAVRDVEFSLFYFSSEEGTGADKYRLLLEGAKFADRNGFSAVWTPERHFHAFGGLYPNPSVTSAAIAAVTERVDIRAGSVVLPLHHPARVAEEWAVVDNISRGRVGISFAAGWQPNDFVLRPENFADAKQVMFREIETVRRLWRGESVTLPGPGGRSVEFRTLPRPVQPELPVWVTTAGNPESFAAAGRAGANVLTHLLGQSVEELGQKLAIYRQAWRDSGHPGEGHVSLMLHAFVGDDDEAVRAVVRRPMMEYLRSSISLIKPFASAFPTFRKQTDPAGGAPTLDFESLSPEEMETLLEYSFERYYETSGLFGTRERCLDLVRRLAAIEVDEVACLIDFGVEEDLVLAHLRHLDDVRAAHRREREVAARDHSIAAQIARHRVTHLQCTPSTAGVLLADERTREAMRSLRTLLIGGEAFPAALAAQLRAVIAGEILNMYGPTETTIWSTTHRLDGSPGAIPIGRPIANTELYIVDASMQPVPVGVAGELLIGGAGVVPGYLRRPELTAERFVPDSFGGAPGARLYRTGDLARYRDDGVVEFLGRIDHQVKIRGHRIELGEIEAVLERHPAVREAVVIAREDAPGDKRLVAYLVPRTSASADGELRDHVREALPDIMVPASFVLLDELPHTPNGKIDRKALPAPTSAARKHAAAFVPPANEAARTIAAIWADVLRLPRVGSEDNFFDLGGHSLLAVQVHSRLRQAGVQTVSITDLFRFPTVRSLAAHLAGAGAGESVAARGQERAQARRNAMLRRQPRRAGS